MYTHCIFCKGDLGANEIIERFPVGRRLAFDATQGRLWVVCKRCNRWNLTPLEERWEAIETCERIYRDTRRRLSTENIGLARVPEGTDLVRIGKPLRPEFAAWRYGPGLRRRRVKRYVMVGAGVTAAVGVVTAPWLIGFGFGASFLYHVPNWLIQLRRATHVLVKLPDGLGEQVCLKHTHIENFRLEAEKYGWVLKLPHTEGTLELRGEEAIRAAALVMPHVNKSGASAWQVERAVNVIERIPKAEALFHAVAQMVSARSPGVTWSGDPLTTQYLALEMVSHEQQERRALEGELYELEAMWREAEEIAAISDDLLLPAAVRNLFRTHKEKQ